MTDNDQAKQTGAAGRKEPWWPWIVGVGAILTVAVFLVLRFVAPPQSQQPGPWGQLAVEPRPISVPAELRPAEVVPAEPGVLAGCSLLLVTLDTTRADRIGCYGNRDIETPTLDALAGEGILFSQAVAPAASTLPAHASILTGLYPSHHGARTNGLFRLPAEQVTLAEVLADRGYATGAFISAWVLTARFGTAQGFGDYDDEVQDVPSQQARDPNRSVFGPVNSLWVHRTADRTTQRAAAWLRAHGGERFFLWVHYYDPHAPYEPPSPFAERHELAYDGEIAFADSELGKLLDILDGLGRTDDTLVVVAGDHGEGLGEHGEWTHCFLLYESVLRVPLIMRCGRRLGGGLHIARQVSLVDVMPTVLSLLGVDGPAESDGVDLTRAASGGRSVFAETWAVDAGLASLRAVRDGSTKYIYGPDPELYALSQDPFEQRNLRTSKPQIAAKMEGQLLEFFGEELADAAGIAPTQTLSQQDLDTLAALGYVSAGGAAAPSGPLLDPKTMVGAIDRIAMLKSRPFQERITALEGIAGQHPGFFLPHLELGQAYLETGDLARGEAALLKGLEAAPGNPHILLVLGRIKGQQQDMTAGIDYFRRVLEVWPEHVEALSSVGALLGQQERFDEAAVYLTQAFRLLPTNNELRERTTAALLAAQRVDEAVGLLDQALRANPELDAVRDSLFELLMGRRRYVEVVALLRDTVQVRPGNLDMANNLAALLSACPDPTVRNPSEAVTVALRLCEQTGHGDARYLLTLSVAHMVAGQMDEAISVAEQAHTIASNKGQVRLAETIRRRLESYGSGSSEQQPRSRPAEAKGPTHRP